MPVGGPLSRQSSAKVQRYVSDHRHAAITGSYYQLLLSAQMVAKTGDPSPPPPPAKRSGHSGGVPSGPPRLRGQ